MLKFVVTKKSNRSSLKKQLRRVTKSLTPTKKVDKTSTGMESSLDSPVLQTLGKFHRAPPPPTSLVNDVTRKRENVVNECENFHTAKEKTVSSFEDQRQKVSSKRSVVKNVSFKDSYLYVTKSRENDASEISQQNTDEDFSRNFKTQSRRKVAYSCLNVSQLSNDLNADNVSRSNSLNISQFSVDSSLGELSFHMQLYEDQLKRITDKTEKLRERDTVIREKFEAVRRKAKQLKIIDDDLMNKTSLCDGGILISSQHARKHEDESVEMKPRDVISVFDNSVCVTRNKSNKTSMGLSSMSVSRKKHLHRSTNSPKRLKRQCAVQKLPRLTSPLARGANGKFSSTRDVILCALSKDNRKFTFC